MKFLFEQVTVFSDKRLNGNPLAVVVGADRLSDEQMTQFAKWTNLSETAYLLQPKHPDADYRVRIFTPEGELPFAGHPTLGSCYVWQQAYGKQNRTTITQECGAGLVNLKQSEGRLAFMAPPLIRTGEVVQDEKVKILKAFALEEQDVEACEWLDNGPGWLIILLKSVDKLLSLTPDYAQLKGYDIGVCAFQPTGHEKQLEVRGFCCTISEEDPVTGSLNAAIAQWLIPQGKLPRNYIAGQGQKVSRDGIIYVSSDEQGIWVAGDVVNCINGSVEFD
ncbi:PhzF family phenazine biosynthesis protein [Providencia alcalifaciens]|nr:PhzF family phenazine biosynthesis protein [Providencia alcalifaciens]